MAGLPRDDVRERLSGRAHRRTATRDAKTPTPAHPGHAGRRPYDCRIAGRNQGRSAGIAVARLGAGRIQSRSIRRRRVDTLTDAPALGGWPDSSASLRDDPPPRSGASCRRRARGVVVHVGSTSSRCCGRRQRRSPAVGVIYAESREFRLVDGRDEGPDRDHRPRACSCSSSGTWPATCCCSSGPRPSTATATS